MNQSSSSSSEGGTSVGCVGAMRGLGGYLVEEIAEHDGFAQKFISFSVHKRSRNGDKMREVASTAKISFQTAVPQFGVSTVILVHMMMMPFICSCRNKQCLARRRFRSRLQCHNLACRL